MIQEGMRYRILPPKPPVYKMISEMQGDYAWGKNDCLSLLLNGTLLQVEDPLVRNQATAIIRRWHALGERKAILRAQTKYGGIVPATKKEYFDVLKFQRRNKPSIGDFVLLTGEVGLKEPIVLNQAIGIVMNNYRFMVCTHAGLFEASTYTLDSIWKCPKR